MTVLDTMYESVPNSPRTYLDGAIGDTDDTINLVDATVLPAAPNLCTLGIGETAETIYYGTKDGNVLSEVVRGYDNTTAAAWTDGTAVARYYTSGDHNTFISNINKIDQQLNPAQSLVISKDNDDVERKFWKDDFSVDTSDRYEIGGTGTISGWGTGVITQTNPSSASIDISDNSNAFKIDYVVAFHTPYIDTDQLLYCQFNGYPSYLHVIRGSGNTISLRGSGVVTITSTSTGTTLSDDDYGIASIIYDGENYQMYWNGVAVGSAVSGDLYTDRNIGIYNVNAGTTYCKSLTYIPSESYSDDLATDTSARYQKITSDGGTTFNTDHIDILTNATENRTRLKSYKFAEGVQKAKFTLPSTGATDDFIGLSIKSDTGLMNDGIGAGLVKTAGGAWNIATLDGTTITDTTTDSTLSDGDSFYVELEADVTGKIWYYIYETTKPTEETGRLYTTKLEGYSGVYAKGAAQTFELNELVMNAESIVGRTNVPVEEEGFVFVDDFSEDSLARYRNPNYFSVVDGYLKFSIAGGFTKNAIVPNSKFTIGEISVDMQQVIIGGSGSTQSVYFGNYYMRLSPVWNFMSVGLHLYKRTDNTLLGSYSVDPTEAQSMQTYTMVITDTSVTVYYNSTPVIMVNTGIVASANTAILSATKVNSADACDFRFDNLQISGTRVYDKPIHRGAMLETYHDGSEEVLGTCWFDDFEADTSAEYTTDTVTFYQTTKKAELSFVRLPRINLTSDLVTTNNLYGSITFSPTTAEIGAFYITCGGVYILYSANHLYKNGGVPVGSFTINRYDIVKITFLNVDSNVILNAYNVTTNVLFTATWTDAIESTLPFAISVYSIVTAKYDVINIQLCIYNDINKPYISSVQHGARYDTLEYVESQLPLTNIAASDIRGISAAQSTLATETADLQIITRNITDDTEIKATETVAMDGSLVDTRLDIETKLDDIDDTMSFKQTTGVQPDGIVYIPITKLKPTVIVQRGELP